MKTTNRIAIMITASFALIITISLSFICKSQTNAGVNIKFREKANIVYSKSSKHDLQNNITINSCDLLSNNTSIDNTKYNYAKLNHLNAQPVKIKKKHTDKSQYNYNTSVVNSTNYNMRTAQANCDEINDNINFNTPFNSNQIANNSNINSRNFPDPWEEPGKTDVGNPLFLLLFALPYITIKLRK